YLTLQKLLHELIKNGYLCDLIPKKILSTGEKVIKKQINYNESNEEDELILNDKIFTILNELKSNVSGLKSDLSRCSPKKMPFVLSYPRYNVYLNKEWTFFFLYLLCEALMSFKKFFKGVRETGVMV
ncbi:hypothetical protein RFI_35317, partial [Reticulomyxa filosa]